MELCRVCVNTHTELMQIFDTRTQNDFVDKIQFCTGVLFKNEECLPSKICGNCVEELNTAHKFKLNCLNSELTFRNLEAKNLKHKLNRDLHNGADMKSDVPNDNTTNDEFFDGSVMKSDEECKVERDENCDGHVSNVDLSADHNSKLEVEEAVVIEKSRNSKRVRLKRADNSFPNEDAQIKTARTRKKRGSYNKTKTPLRLKKLKFKRLCCEVCNLKFQCKKESDEHKKAYHNAPDKWICEICGKDFVHRSSHLAHIRSHYPPRFACDSCDYRSTSKYDLVKHVRIHTGSKSYVCPICASAYRTSSNLHAHVRLTHERVRRFQCPLCARAFYDRTKLNRHLDSHNDIKRYSCEVCHACFTRRCYWKKHLQRQHDIAVPAARPGRRRGEPRDLPGPAPAPAPLAGR